MTASGGEGGREGEEFGEREGERGWERERGWGVGERERGWERGRVGGRQGVGGGSLGGTEGLLQLRVVLSLCEGEWESWGEKKKGREE